MNAHSKQFGAAWVYFPIPCYTGALHTQPQSPDVRLETCCDFAERFTVFFDMRGALDAPETIPSGGVRAQDFEPAEKGRLLVAHVRRDGWHS